MTSFEGSAGQAWIFSLSLPPGGSIEQERGCRIHGSPFRPDPERELRSGSKARYSFYSVPGFFWAQQGIATRAAASCAQKIASYGEPELLQAAFYDRMNQTPVEFIFQKMKAGTDWGAARYEYGIIAHEIERKIDCKAVCFEHYCPKREASVEHPTQYNRLIRDREPAILEKSGKHCIVERLDDKAYLEALDNELQAVLNKYRRKHSLEELADLLELMGCAVKACGFTWEKLRCERMKKRTKCGGFDKRLFLKDVVEEKI